VVALNVSDINSKRMLLKVEQGKGRKGSTRDALAAAARIAAWVVSYLATTGRGSPIVVSAPARTRFSVATVLMQKAPIGVEDVLSP
jgi:hypothetical protein